MLKNTSRNKGVILAGGTGQRLKPNTTAMNKHSFPVYDKPMIYYPLTVLILSGITEIAVVANELNLNSLKRLLGNGRSMGIEFSYFCQKQPLGIVDAMNTCQDFWFENPFALILGDNLFYGSGLSPLLIEAARNERSTIFTYQVANPRNYGVIELSKDGYVKKVLEKPTTPVSDIISTGLYFFSSNLGNYINKVKVSSRGEFEITDLLNLLAKDKLLDVKKLNRGITWLDMGTVDSLLLASNFIKNIQTTQGFIVGSPEEASWRIGNISTETFLKLCQDGSSEYFKKLSELHLKVK